MDLCMAHRAFYSLREYERDLTLSFSICYQFNSGKFGEKRNVQYHFDLVMAILHSIMKFYTAAVAISLHCRLSDICSEQLAATHYNNNMF